MEDNEDEPDDVRKATPVEEEITRGEIDEHSGKIPLSVKLSRRRHNCETINRKKLKKPLRNKDECCRAKLEKAAGAPKTATVLVYEKECTLPKKKPIPRHCLTKEEWIDILATPRPKCPSPCLRREVMRKIRPVSTRIIELAQPPKNRLMNTLQDRAGTLPSELVDNLIQTLEGEACLTPEQAEQMFRDKDIRARKKCRKKKSKLNCKGNNLNKREELGFSSNASAFDKEAVNCQYLMAESFVKSILEWRTPVPREEFQDIAKVIRKRLGYHLEYNPEKGEDRKSQQMKFLADIVASWISGVLFDVAEAEKEELEEEWERLRREQEEESEEDSDDESLEDSGEDDDDDDDEDEDKRKKKGGSPPRKRKDDKEKKGRKDGKDDDDDKKGGGAEKREEGRKENEDVEDDGKTGTEDAEDELEEEGEKEATEENVEEGEPKSGVKDPDVVAESQEKEGVPREEEEYHDAREETDETSDEKKNSPEIKDDSKDEPQGETVISSDKEEAEKDKTDEEVEPESVEGGQQEDDKVLKTSDEAKQGITDESSGIVEKTVDDTVVDISEPLAESKQIEAAPIPVDENIVSEEASVEIAEKAATEAAIVDEGEGATVKTDEAHERGAGDKKDDTEVPVEQITTPVPLEIPETKQKELEIDAEDMVKEIQEDTTEDSTAPILEIRKEESTKNVVTLPGAKEIIETSKKKPSKIPSSILLERRKKFQTDTPFVTFDKIFHTVYNAIEASQENPGIDAITNRLHRAVYEKCSNVVREEKPEPLPELTKDVLEVLSGKIALWLRDVLTESQLSFMNKFPATVESVDVREWTKWIGYVSDTANTWSTWIQRTIRQAEAMRSGKVTRGDWLDWTKSVEEDALLWRRFYVESQHQAHQNLTMIRDRRVVKTGTRDLPDGDYEREMEITDLELEK